MDLLPWRLVEACIEIHGNFHCRWKWSFDASINLQLHEYFPWKLKLPWTSFYPYILPPTSTSITNSQLIPQDFRKGQPTFVRFTSVEVSNNFLPWKSFSFHGSFSKPVEEYLIPWKFHCKLVEVDLLPPWKSAETSMEVHGSFHRRWNWKLPSPPVHTSACFLYRLKFAFLFTSLLSLVVDSVFLLFRLDATPTPRAPCEPDVCVFPLRAVFFIAFLLLICFLLLLFLPFFDFDLDIVCFMLSFSCEYYAISSVSVSAATRLAYDMYIDTHLSWSHLCIFCRRHTICFSCGVHYLFSFTGFPPEVIFRSRVIGVCPVTTDCVAAMS